MNITKDCVASFDYILKDEKGQLIDSSEQEGPLVYLHGSGQLIPGLENKLEGKKIGDRFDISIAPADGYGERSDDMIQKVPKTEFQDANELQVGSQFQVEAEGGPVLLTVISIDDKEVILDGNHPLAGVTLKFNVTITEVRKATPEEISHGHVHGAGGHDH